MAESIKYIMLDTHFSERRGNLTVVEDFPFKVKRAFWVYNIPLDEMRGGHSHKKCHQFFIAVCGAVIVKASEDKSYILDCPDVGLYVPPMNLINYIPLEEETTLLIFASEKFSEEDYVYGSNDG